MKLLIVAGPYEADRIRRAAASAGFEAIAVESGESLSGWLSGTRPDIIVMAPNVVSSDPRVALAKIRSQPAGRVPVFLVGDAEDEPRLLDLGDGFFKRPISMGDLVHRARERLGLPALPSEKAEPARVSPDTKAEADPAVVPASGSGVGPSPLLDLMMSQNIDERFDDLMDDAVRTAGVHRRPDAVSRAATSRPGHQQPVAPRTPVPASPPGPPAVRPARDETAATAGGAAGSGLTPPVSLAAALEPAAVTGELLSALDVLDRAAQAGSAESARAPAAIPSSAPEEAPTGEGRPLLSANAALEAAAEFESESSNKTVEAPEALMASMVASSFQPPAVPKAPAVVAAPPPPQPPPPGRVPAAHPSAAAVRPADPPPVARSDGLVLDPAPVPVGPPLREVGELAEEDMPLLLARIYADGFSGRLAVRRAEAEKSIFFDGGYPVLATSNVPNDRMADMLFHEGKLSREQYARSRDIVAETGRRMGAVLVDLGYLKASELFAAVRRHYEEILYSLFSWDRGEWRMVYGEPPVEEKIRLACHPAALLLEGVRRKYPLERLMDRVGPPAAVMRTVESVGTADLLAEAALTADELKVVPLLDGIRTLKEVGIAAGVADDVVYALCCALLALRVVVPLRRDVADDGSLAGAELHLDRAIDRERIVNRYALALDGDYFQILGVHRDASGHEIRRAHEEAVRQFASDRIDPQLATDLGKELGVIRCLFQEAARVLGDDELRVRYRTHLRFPG